MAHLRASALSSFLLSSFAALPAQTPTPLTTELFGWFTAPVQLLAAPGDPTRIFVVEKTGRIQLHKDGSVLPTPFLDISGLTVANYEQGLLGMAFHPQYQQNGLFFVDYIDAATGATVVARYRILGGTDFDRADPASATTILTIVQPYANHNGGTIHFGSDGFLYIGTGDGGSGNDPQGNAQNVGALLGKLLRIDVDLAAGGLPYGIPIGNPFRGSVPGRDEVLMIGLRNPWQWSFDRATGDLYIGDVGQNAIEEIDFVPASQLQAGFTAATVPNFGWRCMEGSNCTGLGGCACNGANLRTPIHEYPNQPGRAVIGGYVYRGCAIPDLRGTYFYADHSGMLGSLRVAGGVATNLIDRTAELDPPGPDTITSVAAFGEDACGELYVLEHGGQIWKIVPVPPAPSTGLAVYGSGTPGCSGAHTLWASCPPTLGNAFWRLTSAHAPPSGFGIATLAEVADVPGSDPFGIGLQLHFALSPAVYQWLAMADAAGNGSAWLAIPNNPLLVGWQVYAQLVWLWPAGTCTPSVFGLSSTPGLSIVFQP